MSTDVEGGAIIESKAALIAHLASDVNRNRNGASARNTRSLFFAAS